MTLYPPLGDDDDRVGRLAQMVQTAQRLDALAARTGKPIIVDRDILVLVARDKYLSRRSKYGLAHAARTVFAGCKIQLAPMRARI